MAGHSSLSLSLSLDCFLWYGKLRAKRLVCRAIAIVPGERGKSANSRVTCHDVEYTRGAGVKRRKKSKRKGGSRGDSRRRKRSYDRAFLVVSIHVSSVTRVMSVGNTRFLESSGAVFSFRPLFPLFLSPLPSTWLTSRRYLLLSISVYVHGK